MRVLTLTWEFPPVITGGLGMACYGIVKAMLKQGISVDLIIPAKIGVYFSLRNEQDVDNLPIVFTEPGKEQSEQTLSVEKLKELVGSPVSVYQTMSKIRSMSPLFQEPQSEPFKYLMEMLSDESYLCRQVKDYTAMAVDIGRKLDYDIIHAHDWLTYPSGMLLKSITGKPLVVHIHATEFDRAGGAGDRKIHNIEYAGMKYADRVIAVSDYTANLVRQRYHISAEKTKVVHNAYELSHNPNNHRRIFKEPTVLFLGRITLQKGPDYFLEVARRVCLYNKKVRFVMAGSGDMEKQILHKAASLGLGTKFLVAGFLERSEVEKILSSTDIFLLPSVSEPFGIVPLEAMSHGAVAIISKNAGVAEIIESAYKIDFWDIDQIVSTILDLIENPAKLKMMSIQGQAEAVKLKWEDAVEKIVDVFYELELMAKC